MPPALPPARRLTVLLTFVAALLIGAATTQASPVALGKPDLPGAKKTSGSPAALRAALIAAMRGGPRAAVRKAPAVASGFTSGPYRLLNGSVELSSPSAAKAARRAAGTRKRIGKRGSTATVAVQSGALVGLVSVSAKGRNATVAAYATAVARTLQARLDAAADTTVATVLEEDAARSKASALALFKLAYGTMPGAMIPAGRRGQLSEGTLALQRVWALRDQLTAAQRAAFDRAAGNTAARRARRSTLGHAARLAHAHGARPRTLRARRLGLTPDPAAQTMADAFAAMYADPSRLGPFPAPMPRVYRSSEDIEALADAQPVNAAGIGPAERAAFHECQIRLDPSYFLQPAASQAGILAHEVFHCVHHQISLDWDAPVGPWVTEGLADWAASQITAIPADTPSYRHFRTWLAHPDGPLFDRTYSAVGFWGHQHERLGDLWPRVRAIILAGDYEPAFEAGGGNEPDLLETSASALLRIGGPTSAWIQNQPWSTTDATIHTPRGVTASAGADLSAAAHTNQLTDVQPLAEAAVIELGRSSGHVRSTDGFTDFPDAASRFFCLPAGACVCPPGETEINLPSPLPEVGSLTVALSGDVTGGAATIERHPMKEYCKKEVRAPRPGGHAGSVGDPHLTSTDGLRYDFQAAGEFVLVKSGDDLAVQARHESLKYGKTVVTTMTINTQLGFKVGDARVTIGVGAPPVVRVNGGSPQTLAAGVTLPVGAGSITSDGKQYTLTWPDGSTATVWPVRSRELNLLVDLADARKGKVAGLLGNFDDDPRNDLRTRGGKVLPIETVTEDWLGLDLLEPKHPTGAKVARTLYDTLGESWRISQKESLLDYRPGETTETFTDRSIPRKLVAADDLPASKRAKAEAICRAAGLTAAAALEDCFLDVALTGDSAFADAAAREELNRASTDWTRLAAGATRLGALSLARTGDGTLHLVWDDQNADGRHGIVHDALPAGGGERGPVTVAPYDGTPYIYVDGGGALRMVAATIDIGPPLTQGIVHYASTAPYASWSAQPMVATAGVYAGAPVAAEAAGHMITVNSLASTGKAYLDTGTGENGGELLNGPAAATGCRAMKPSVASAGAETYAAFWQQGCAQPGLFLVPIDPTTGKPGEATPAPQSTFTGSLGPTGWDAPGLEHLSMAGRPGGGVFLAYARQDAGAWTVFLWRIGAPAPLVVASGLKVQPRSLQVSAEPSTGSLWVAWQSQETLSGKGRLAVRRTNAAADGWAGSAREIAFPSGSDLRAVPVFPWDVLARDGGLDVIAGYPAGSDYPGAMWRTTLRG